MYRIDVSHFCNIKYIQKDKRSFFVSFFFLINLQQVDLYINDFVLSSFPRVQLFVTSRL